MTKGVTHCSNILNVFDDGSAILCFIEDVPLNDPLLYSGGSLRRFFSCLRVSPPGSFHFLDLSCCGFSDSSREYACTPCTG